MLGIRYLARWALVLAIVFSLTINTASACRLFRWHCAPRPRCAPVVHVSPMCAPHVIVHDGVVVSEGRVSDPYRRGRGDGDALRARERPESPPDFAPPPLEPLPEAEAEDDEDLGPVEDLEPPMDLPDDSGDVLDAPPPDDAIDLFDEPAPADDTDDLFDEPAPAEDETDDLFGEPEPAGEDADDLFDDPGPAEDDAGDLFGEPEPVGEDTDDLFDDPGPAEDDAGDLFDEPAPAEEDADDLFDDPGPADDDAGDLFGEPEPAGDDADDLFGDADPANDNARPLMESASPLVEDRSERADSIVVSQRSFAAPETGKDSGKGMRVWTDNSGRYHTKGRLVLISQTHVRLLKDNGRHSTVPLSRLSSQDLTYVVAIAKKLTGGTERIASR